ncbi:MAG: type pilus assembly protein PilM [Clostridia bacterium]|jgi:hypothetical protein|nr:type pilus assembly protein PilM [Clostridia bacterium]MDN5323706.1 type pilus assembly protein PilM [Clostridia bacterium]
MEKLTGPVFLRRGVVEDLFSKNKKKVAVHISDDRIFIAVANYKDKIRTIEYLTQLPLDGQELSMFVEKNKLKKLPVYIALGGKQIISRVISLPEIPEKELEQVLQWEVTKYIPIPPEELLFDFEILGKITGLNSNQLRLLIIAARKQYVENYCDILAQAGLMPQVVDVEGTILKYLYLHLQNKEEGDTVCCIYLDEQRGVFSFLTNGNIFFIHNVDWDQEITNRLVAEYQRVNSYLHRQLQMISSGNIYLFGPRAGADTANLLKAELGINVINVDLKNESLDLLQVGTEINSSYTFALGLLLREVE